MNRQQVLKQRAARKGIYVARIGAQGRWDIVDACGPTGQSLTKRAAINEAARRAHRLGRSRFYVWAAASGWHRSTCEEVAIAGTVSHRCKCQYLVV